MSDTEQARDAAWQEGGSDYGRRTASHSARWFVFAAIMAITVGFSHIMMGLVALLNDTYYLVSPTALVVSLDYTAWGWAHLILGVAAVAAGFGILQGRAWARMLGIALAALGAIVNLGFLSAYPVWCAIVIALDIIVIYALTVRWDDTGT